MKNKELPGGRKPYKISSNIDKTCYWCKETIPCDTSYWQYPYLGPVHDECSKSSRSLILKNQPKPPKKKIKAKSSVSPYLDKKGRNPFIAPKGARGWRDIV